MTDGLDPADELAWLRRLRDLTGRLAREADPAGLVPAILDCAIELARAERGYLVRVPPTAAGKRPRVRVEVARGFDRAALDGGGGRVSRKVVARVLAERRGLVTGGDDADLRAATTLRERGTAAALCVPLLVGDEVRAVLYLDHRLDPHAFGPRALSIVSAFADQAALALDAAEARAARRAPPDVGAPIAAAPPPGLAPADSRSGGLVGRTPAARALVEEVERAARAGGPVLVVGEPGSEVEAVARELHARGPRPGEPLVVVRAALLSDAALEDELFGHRRGATRRGALARAGRGTLVVEDVDRLGPAARAGLLRALQDGVVRPAGSDVDRQVACRVVATTCVDLAADLLARFALRVRVPPLRQRLDDVPLLLTDRLARLRPLGQALSPEAALAVARYPWPDNARELEAEAQRLAATGELVLEPRHLSPQVRGGRGLVTGDAAGKTLADAERSLVEQALRESAGNKARAARQLGVPKTTLYHLLDRYGLR